MSLKALAREINKCKKCGLCKGRTKAVPGEGDRRNELFLIGEGPGKEEDLSGRPFVGRSGHVLRTTLAKFGINPLDDCFITSIVKCRPPKNRAPKNDEIETCTSNYLFKQITEVKPKLIVLLGGTAANFFFPKTKIMDLRGKIIEKDGLKFFITYHPAAALRSPIQTKKKFEEDIRKIREILYIS